MNLYFSSGSEGVCLILGFYNVTIFFVPYPCVLALKMLFYHFKQSFSEGIKNFRSHFLLVGSWLLVCCIIFLQVCGATFFHMSLFFNQVIYKL